MKTGEFNIPKSWVFEISDDGMSWEIIDCRDNQDDLDPQVIHNFSTEKWHQARFVRFRMTGQNGNGTDVLTISALEIFGTLTNIPRPVVGPGEFAFYDLEPLNGITEYLTRKCQMNLHYAGVVEATASSYVIDVRTIIFGTEVLFGIFSPEQALPHGHGYEPFLSENKPNSWICYDFKERRVNVTSYSLRPTNCPPMSWVFEASNDAKSWEVIDRQSNYDLNQSFILENFSISSGIQKSFRFVRLRQTGKNKQGTDHLSIKALEIFGTLTDIPEPVARPGEFVFCDMRPHDGIINHLRQEHGGNVHTSGVVEVTASSTHAYNSPDAAIHDHKSDIYRDTFMSEDQPNSWICYDFKQRRVIPTSYSITNGSYEISTSNRPIRKHPKSWVFEASNDRTSWDIIDHRENTNILYGFHVTRNFSIIPEPRSGYRFLRLRQTGKNHYGNDVLVICRLEIFGVLLDPKAKPGLESFKDSGSDSDFSDLSHGRASYGAALSLPAQRDSKAGLSLSKQGPVNTGHVRLNFKKEEKEVKPSVASFKDSDSDSDFSDLPRGHASEGAALSLPVQTDSKAALSLPKQEPAKTDPVPLNADKKDDAVKPSLQSFKDSDSDSDFSDLPRGSCAHGYKLDDTPVQEVAVVLSSDKPRPPLPEPPITPQVKIHQDSHRLSTARRAQSAPSSDDPHYADRSQKLFNQIIECRQKAKVPTDLVLKDGKALNVAKKMAHELYSKTNDDPVEMTARLREPLEKHPRFRYVAGFAVTGSVKDYVDTALPKIKALEAGRNMILHAQCNQVAIAYWNRKEDERVCVAFVFSYFE